MKKQQNDLAINQAANSTQDGDRRVLLKSVLAGGAIAASLPSSWRKPVLDSVILPAHAQASVCPVLVLGNGLFSPGSAPGTCGLSVELLSSDAAEDIEVLSITNTTPVPGDAVTYPSGSSGTLTSTVGLTISWVGQAIGAPFACSTNPPVPVNEVMFTVEFNCNSGPEVQTVTYSLQNDIAPNL